MHIYINTATYLLCAAALSMYQSPKRKRLGSVGTSCRYAVAKMLIDCQVMRPRPHGMSIQSRKVVLRKSCLSPALSFTLSYMLLSSANRAGVVDNGRAVNPLDLARVLSIKEELILAFLYGPRLAVHNRRPVFPAPIMHLRQRTKRGADCIRAMLRETQPAEERHDGKLCKRHSTMMMSERAEGVRQ